LVRRWWWLKILIGGVVLLFLVDWVLLSSQDPVFIPSVMLIGAFLVPVVFVTYLYEHMPAWDVPLSALATCFLWGGAIGTVVAGALEFRTLRSLGAFQLLGVGLIEESAKLIFPVIFYFLGRYRSEPDGIILGVSTAMGFAALETLGYSFVSFLQSGGDLLTLDEELFVRGLLSPTNHAAWTGLVCAVLFRERLRAGRGVLNYQVVGAFLTAVVLHALWDFFNSLAGMAIVDLISNLLSLLLAIVSLTLLIRRVREARRALPTEQP
jgi:RsiW-degrading membrane proteinase PrsW (M82 family)